MTWQEVFLNVPRNIRRDIHTIVDALINYQTWNLQQKVTLYFPQNKRYKGLRAKNIIIKLSKHKKGKILDDKSISK